MITIQELTQDDWTLWRALRVAALADAPDAFGANLLEWTGEGDAEARWRSRLITVPFNVIGVIDGRASGMSSGTEPVEGVVWLMSMWVDPRFRSCGVGDALVDAVVRWAKDQGAGTVALNVRQSNERAIAFYHRNGFSDDGWSSEPGAVKPEMRMVRQVP